MNLPEQLFSLQGKTAVVIGGTGELCGAMAEGLAGAGAETVLVGRSQAGSQRARALTKSPVQVVTPILNPATLETLLHSRNSSIRF